MYCLCAYLGTTSYLSRIRQRFFIPCSSISLNLSAFSGAASAAIILNFDFWARNSLETAPPRNPLAPTSNTAGPDIFLTCLFWCWLLWVGYCAVITVCWLYRVSVVVCWFVWTSMKPSFSVACREYIYFTSPPISYRYHESMRSWLALYIEAKKLE